MFWFYFYKLYNFLKIKNLGNYIVSIDQIAHTNSQIAYLTIQKCRFIINHKSKQTKVSAYFEFRIVNK